MFEIQKLELRSLGGCTEMNTCKVYEKLKEFMSKKCKTCSHKQYLDEDYYICDLTNTEVKEDSGCERWEE